VKAEVNEYSATTEWVDAQAQHAPPQQRKTDKQTERLLQLLLKKGVITEEEWRKANQP